LKLADRSQNNDRPCFSDYFKSPQTGLPMALRTALVNGEGSEMKSHSNRLASRETSASPGDEAGASLVRAALPRY
jgi:hypothetical protein